MALSVAQISNLDNMCPAAKDAQLGSFLRGLNSVKVGTYTAVAADATANKVMIDLESTFASFIVQVYRAGVLLGGCKVSASEGVLTIEDNSTDYVVTADDVINYIVF